MIKIGARLITFSHRPGIRLLLPESRRELQVFPTLLRVDDEEFQLGLKGPVLPFTVEQDLERGRVRIFGQKQDGFFSLILDGGVLRVERLQGDLEIAGKRVSRGDEVKLGESASIEANEERLSLGMHRALEWDEVEKRQDLRELLPLLHRLHLWTPAQNEAHGGTRELLDEAVSARLRGDKTKLMKALEQLFRCAFEGMLVPRLSDPHHWGIVTGEGKGSPFFLIEQGGALIRSLFFDEQEEGIHLLPCVPSHFHAGRFMGLKTRGGALIHVEWTKDSLRQVEISGPAQTLLLHLPKGIHRYRVRRKRGEKGKFFRRNDALELNGKEKLLLDRFEI